MGHLKKFLCFLIQWPSWKYIFRTVLNNRSICKVWCFLSSEKLPFGSFPIGFLVRFFQQMCFVLNFDKISRLEGKAGLRFPRPRVNDSHSVPFNLDKMSGSRVIYESQLRNLGWPLRARFVRDKKLNRFLRTNGFVQRVIDRTGAKQGGEKFSSPDGKAAETSIRANALQIARRLVHRNLQQGQQWTSRQFVRESTSLCFNLQNCIPLFLHSPPLYLTWRQGARCRFWLEWFKQDPATVSWQTKKSTIWYVEIDSRVTSK